MIDTSQGKFQDDFDENKFDKIYSLLEEYDMPFIIVMNDMKNHRVYAVGNFNDWEQGVLIMADLLRTVSQKLTQIEVIDNPPGKDN